MKFRTHIALAVLVAAVAAQAGYAGTAANQPTKADASDVVSRYLDNHTQALAVDTSDVVSRYLQNHMQAPAGLDPAVRAAINAHDGANTSDDVVSRYLRNHTQAPARLDPAVRAAISAHVVADTSDVVSRYVRNHTQALAAPVSTGNAAGFDWADAGIGAGGILGVMLLAGTAVLAVRQGRKSLASA